MVLVKFIDGLGNPLEFRHGLYAVDDAQLDWPMTCATCLIRHDQVALAEWATYESSNLLSLLAPESGTVLVTQVSLYAAGHAYKVYISEVNLIATP